MNLKESSDAEISRLQTELEAARQKISLLKEFQTKQLNGMYSNSHTAKSRMHAIITINTCITIPV